MSEMSAEKKKQIERYIIKSYFGGCKNVESLANGADVIKGTDDGYIPQLIVEVTYFGESGIVMIKWNVYGDSQQNSFSMHICREREIEHNRCDSVDSMVYTWETCRAKIQGKPIFSKTNDEDLQKDKCIEELEKTVKALRAENEELKNALHEFDPIPEYKELLEKLYSVEDVNKLEWTLNHICGGQASVNGWKARSKFWRQNCETLFKLVGFSSVEEIQDYLANEAEADTLHEAISKLHDQVKYTCDEWYSANSRNNSWKAAAECNSPKELIEKLNLLRDDISGRSTVIESYKRDIKKWQTATGCLRPEDISTESMISKSMANEITVANEELWSENKKCEKRIEALQKEIGIYSHTLKEWKEGTGCPSPSAAKTMIECQTSWHHAYEDAKKEIKEWKDATGCTAPRQAIIRIRGLENAVRRADINMLKELDSEIDEWQKATGCDSPEEAKEKLGGFIQAASCAEKHLEHILLWRPEQTGQEVE